MKKRIDYVVAIILKNKQHPDEFLIVKRPSDDADLRGNWGLPAVTLRPGELPEQGAERACREKLNCQAKATRFLGIMFQKRNSYDIFLMDIDMELVEGQPDVQAATTANTKYIEQKWTTDPLMLMPSAKEGSCCSSIFLSDRGLLDREDWVNSLEGTDKVA